MAITDPPPDNASPSNQDYLPPEEKSTPANKSEENKIASYS